MTSLIILQTVPLLSRLSADPNTSSQVAKRLSSPRTGASLLCAVKSIWTRRTLDRFWLMVPMFNSWATRASWPTTSEDSQLLSKRHRWLLCLGWAEQALHLRWQDFIVSQEAFSHPIIVFTELLLLCNQKFPRDFWYVWHAVYLSNSLATKGLYSCTVFISAICEIKFSYQSKVWIHY